MLCDDPLCPRQLHSPKWCRGRCAVEGCEATAVKRDWCNPHYRRFMAHGDPTAGTAANGAGLRWLREAVANRDRSSCWLDWPYARGAGGGYPVLRQGKATTIVLELDGRPRPPGMECCHAPTCEDRACVNPDHLRWDTHAENQRDIARRGHGAWRNRYGSGTWSR